MRLYCFHEKYFISTQQEVDLKLFAAFVVYLERVGQTTSTLTGNWFTRYEVHFVHQLLMLAAERKNLVQHQSAPVFHLAAMSIMTSSTSGNEFIAIDCLRHVIFNPEFILKGTSELEDALQTLHISQPNYKSMLQKVVGELSDVATFYIRQFFSHQIVVTPDTYFDPGQSNLKLTVKQHQIIPNDWIYLPLIVLYKKSLDNQRTDENHDVAIRSLQAVYVLLSFCPTWFFRIHPTEHYCRLACVFLAGKWQRISINNIVLINFLI